jgi:hypothetical protein
MRSIRKVAVNYIQRIARATSERYVYALSEMRLRCVYDFSLPAVQPADTTCVSVPSCQCLWSNGVQMGFHWQKNFNSHASVNHILQFVFEIQESVRRKSAESHIFPSYRLSPSLSSTEFRKWQARSRRTPFSAEMLRMDHT